MERKAEKDEQAGMEKARKAEQGKDEEQSNSDNKDKKCFF
jgi:hypothetical protein